MSVRPIRRGEAHKRNYNLSTPPPSHTSPNHHTATITTTLPNVANMSNSHHDDDLGVEKTEGFKVGEKKTVEEYLKTGKDECIRFNLSAYSRVFVAFLHVYGKSFVASVSRLIELVQSVYLKILTCFARRSIPITPYIQVTCSPQNPPIFLTRILTQHPYQTKKMSPLTAGKPLLACPTLQPSRSTLPTNGDA